MSEADEQTKQDAEDRTHWNEEYDAWLELIEDHLKAIRREQLAILILLALLLLITGIIYFPWMFRFMR